MLQEHLEPESTAEATHRAVKILDASYEKADLRSIVNECEQHLTRAGTHKIEVSENIILRHEPFS